MAHPDHIVPVSQKGTIQRIEPVYPLTAGLSPKTLVKAINGAMDRLPDLPEWLDPAQRARDSWPLWGEALRTAHHPDSGLEIELTNPVRQRLAYD